MSDGFYTKLMIKLQAERNRLFKLKCHDGISDDEFDKETQRLNDIFEKEYFKFIAAERMFMSLEELQVDFGFKFDCQN